MTENLVTVKKSVNITVGQLAPDHIPITDGRKTYGKCTWTYFTVNFALL